MIERLVRWSLANRPVVYALALLLTLFGVVMAVRTPVDVLPDPSIREELSALSNWPTIPQVFVAGELVGGADIVQELAVTGQLEATLDEKLGESWRRPGDERTVEVLESGAGGGLRLAPPSA